MVGCASHAQIRCGPKDLCSKRPTEGLQSDIDILVEANLTGGNLSGAYLSDKKLDYAILCHTKMPDGKEENSGCKK